MNIRQAIKSNQAIKMFSFALYFAQACPFWDTWTLWSDCSVTCGGGTMTRERECVNGAQGDDGCNGSTLETLDCSKQVIKIKLGKN